MMPSRDEYDELSSTPSLISITSTQFLKLVKNAREGTPPGNGWGFFPYVKCKRCKCAWEAEAMFNTKGRECPYCGFYDKEAVWTEQTEYKGEGAFLNPVGKDYSIVNKN